MTRFLVVDYDTGACFTTNDAVKAHEYAEKDDVYQVVAIDQDCLLDLSLNTPIPSVDEE